MFQGCSGVVPGCSGLFRWCSGGVPGCSGGVPGCSGVFRGVPGFTDTRLQGLRATSLGPDMVVFLFFVGGEGRGPTYLNSIPYGLALIHAMWIRSHFPGYF